jgi:CBS domain-containing membrane protein
MTISSTSVTSGRLRRLVRGFGPAMPRPALAEGVRAASGAGLGLLVCAAVVALIGGHDAHLFLVAPLGATAVLVFAVPNSPLAQPWSAVVGNVASALVAIAAVTLVPAPWVIGVAVGGAILAMMALRALHPPGGAVALLAALDPEAVRDAGISFALLPVGATTALVVAAGLAFNRLTGRVYPFRQAVPPSSKPDPRLGLTTDELSALLTRFHQDTNLGVADLGRLLAAAEAEAAHHRFDATTCTDIMTTKLITVAPDTPASTVAELFRRHAIKSIPVIDGPGRLQGIILQSDLLRALMPEPGRAGAARALMDNRSLKPLRRDLRAADIMQRSVATVPDDMPVGALLNALATQAVQVIPVVRGDRLVGILTRSDIIALLLKDGQGRQAA